MLSAKWIPAKTLGGLLVLLPVAAAQSLLRASVSSHGTQATGFSYRPSLSSEGRFVAFDSIAPNLVPGDGNSDGDVFVMDLSTGLLDRVSVGLGGAQTNDSSDQPAISGDGQFVAFVSRASNLVPGDTQGTEDVFLFDRTARTTVRVSVDSSGNPGTGGNGTPPSLFPAISRDGMLVLFSSVHPNLVAGDSNDMWDVFAHDRLTGVTERVSVSTTGAEADSASFHSAASDDGRFVLFESYATNLVPGDAQSWQDVFVRDRQAGTTQLVSIGLGGAPGNFHSALGGISSDGRFVAFSGTASDLVPGDTNGKGDVFVRDLQAGVTSRVSVASDGTQGNFDSGASSISGDGRWVAFQSDAHNLVPQSPEFWADVFLHDRSTGTTTILSAHPTSNESNQGSRSPVISADGHRVAFVAEARNLVPDDSNQAWDVLVWSDAPVPPAPVSYGTGTVNADGCTPYISWNGNPSLSSAFYVSEFRAVPDRFGLMIYGVNGPANIPFSGGTRYVASPFKRTPTRYSLDVNPAGTCDGQFAINMTAFTLGLAGGNPLPALSVPGTVVNCQWWGRDGSFGTQLSNAIEYTVAP